MIDLSKKVIRSQRSSRSQFKGRFKSSSPCQASVNGSNSCSLSSERRARFTGLTACYGCNRKGHSKKFAEKVGALVHFNINVENVTKYELIQSNNSVHRSEENI